MRNHRVAAPLAAMVMAAAAGAAEPPPAVERSARFGWFATLAGSCWHGEYPDGGGDTQCYEWQYGRYLRGTIEIDGQGADGKTFKLAGDSVYDWDANAGRMRYSTWADVGQLQHGEAWYEGETLLFPDVKSRDEEPRSRSRWRKIDADSFEVTREKRDDAGWVVVFRVTYRRAAP